MRVLILRALGLGDTVTALPALRGIRRGWPDAELIIGCPPHLGRWLQGFGVVDGVVPMGGLDDVASCGVTPDVAVDLHGRGPLSHRLLRSLSPKRLVAFRCPEAGVWSGPQWREQDHEVDRWLRLVNHAGGAGTVDDLRLRPRQASGRRGGGPVVIHPGAAAPSRRWPVPRWQQVAQALSDEHPIAVTGVPAEAEICAAVARVPGVDNRCGVDDMTSLTRLVADARLVVSGDTGVAHLATALATPSVTLFGPVSPSIWGPRLDPDLHTVMWAPDQADADALRPGDAHGMQVDPRLARIHPADVLDAVARLL